MSRCGGAVYPRPMRSRRRPAAALLLALALLAGCGDDGEDGAGPPPGSGSCEVQVGGEAAAKPQVTVPSGCTAPGTLQVRDVTAGSGAPVAAGQTAVVQYVGLSWSDGQQFDASWDRGQPFPVQNVGRAQVIDGWNEGLIGMRPGGRRLLVIPPEQGYGASGSGPIGPNETLVFVVDLVQVG